MKKTLVLIACLLALALSASAQNQINFANLPLVSTPTPMPNAYSGLNWNNISYGSGGSSFAVLLRTGPHA